MVVTAVIKDDPLLKKIRRTLKEFKENIMLDAKIKLKKWEDKKNGRSDIKNRD